jgi:hypothetical protein
VVDTSPSVPPAPTPLLPTNRTLIPPPQCARYGSSRSARSLGLGRWTSEHPPTGGAVNRLKWPNAPSLSVGAPLSAEKRGVSTGRKPPAGQLSCTVSTTTCQRTAYPASRSSERSEPRRTRRGRTALQNGSGVGFQFAPGGLSPAVRARRSSASEARSRASACSQARCSSRIRAGLVGRRP